MRIEEGKMYVDVETVTGEIVEIEIGPFEEAQTDNVDLAKEWLLWLETMLRQPYGQPHHRNETAVNTSCLLRVLGIDDVVDFIKHLDRKTRDCAGDDGLVRPSDWYSLLDAFERVCGGWQSYLDKWDDGEAGVLEYMV